MASKDVLLDVLEKFTSPYINLTPFEREDPDGRRLLPLTNLGMGYVFEELIRKFNEENNEEAGEHFTPREVIKLMTHIVFEPIKDNLPPVMTIYDPACGSGGMLTESQNFIKDEDGEIRASGDVYLFGKEINDETYAICKSDMMIKGNDPQNIRVGSTLSTDEFAGHTFDFMLSNPPYGKTWSIDLKYIKDGKDIIDPRFVVTLKDYWGEPEEVDAVPRSSDGQLLFLMEMVNKMKPLTQSPQGTRIASVHNGSSLFTGDAGGGESNIRRYIIENDLLDCIVQLPNNLFCNTGITTYIWFLKFLIPKLIVKSKEDKLIDELLESVDLSTYGLERTKLNHSMGLDDSESELNPQNPNPRGINGGDEEKDPLDEIIKSFNERWFHGWDATPEEHRIKFLSLSKHIQTHPDYQTKVADNYDLENRDLAFKKILDDVMGKQRKKELELYKLYAKDESFYQALFDTMKRIVDNPRL